MTSVSAGFDALAAVVLSHGKPLHLKWATVVSGSAGTIRLDGESTAIKPKSFADELATGDRVLCAWQDTQLIVIQNRSAALRNANLGDRVADLEEIVGDGSGTVVNWSNILNKPSSFPPSSHSHAWGEVTGKPAAFPPTIGSTASTAKAGNWLPTWSDVQSKPSVFPAAAHSHAWGEITGKPSTFPVEAHTHTASDISDSTTVGRNVLMAVNATAARSAIGAGTSNLVIGTTASTAKAGNWVPTWADVSDKPATFPPDTHTHSWGDITGAPPQSTNNVPGAAVVRTEPSGSINIGPATTGTQAVTLTQMNDALGDLDIASSWDDISDKPATFPPSAHTHTWAQISGKPTSFNPAPHDHTASEISDSSVVGRSVLTADDAAAARTAIGAGTSNLALGYTSTTAKAGDWLPMWSQVTDKPATFSPIIGTTASTAKAGNWTPSWAEVTSKPTSFNPTSHTHPWAEVTGKPATFPPTTGTTATTAKPGNWFPTWTEVSGKPATFPPAAHVHMWEDIDGKPSVFPPSAHGHGWGDITGKPGTFPPEAHSHPWSQVTGKPTTFPPEGHTHVRADITDLTPEAEGNVPGSLVKRTSPSGSITVGPATAPTHAVTLNQLNSAISGIPTVVEWDDIEDKPSAFPPSAHTHTWGQLVGKPTTFAPIIGTTADVAKAGNWLPTWAEVSDKPATFPPSAHTHTWAQISGKPTSFNPAPHDHTASEISDSSVVGRNVLTADDAATARAAIGAGTSNLALGTTATTAKAGNWTPTWAQVSGKPATFAPAAHTHPVSDLSGVSTAVADLLGAEDAAAARTAIGAGTSNLVLGYGIDSAKPGNWLPLWSQISDRPGTFAPIIGTTASTAKAGNWFPSWGEVSGKPSTFAPSAHTHVAGDISDSTTVGRNVLTAANAAAARTAIGAGTGSSNLALGTTASTAKPGNWMPTWSEVSGKPAAYTPSAHTHERADITGLSSESETNIPGSLVKRTSPSGSIAIGPASATNQAVTLGQLNDAISGVSPSVSWDDIENKPIQFPPMTHSHAISHVTGLQAALDGKAASSHTHTWAQVSGKPTTFAPIIGTTATTAKAGNWTPTWAEVSGKPTTFAPSAHDHSASDISDLPGISPFVVPGTLAQRNSVNGGLTVGPATGDSDAVTLAQMNSAISGIPAPVVTWAEVTGKPATFAPIIGTTASTAKAGNWTPTWSQVSGKPSTFAPSAHSHAWDDIEDKPATFAPATHSHPSSQISDSTTTGRSVLTAASAAAARTAIGAGTSSLAIGTTASTAKAGNWVPAWGDVSGKPATFPPATHTHVAADLSDSTTTGRAVLTAASAAAARTAIGAGTSSLVLGSTSSTAKAGNWMPSWAEVSGKPATFAPAPHTHVWADISNAPAFSKTPVGDTLVQRDILGRVQVGAPHNDSDAVTKLYVDSALSEAGAGVPISTESYVIYATASSGVQTTIPYGQMASGHVVQRDFSGHINVPSNPSAPNHAVPLSYVSGKADLNHTHSWGQITGKPEIAQASTPNTLVERDLNGRVYVVDPIVPAQAATKNYVDNQVSGKVNSFSLSNRIYATSASGTDMAVSYGISALVNYIPQRTTGGHLLVPNSPTANNHAASKNYVDTWASGLDARVSDLEQDTGWVEFPSATGYNTGSGTYAPAYRIKNGVVYLKGWIAKNSGNFTTSYATVATIPSAAIPSIDAGAFNTTTGQTTTNNSGSPFVVVNSAGGIRVAAAPSPGASRVYLSGITYPL